VRVRWIATISAINREQGLTILLVEQNAQAAMALCDYGYIIENGRIVLHGSREKLSENEDVRNSISGFRWIASGAAFAR
jgi:branched-chain amino acid transport system ATP-binding protein